MSKSIGTLLDSLATSLQDACQSKRALLATLSLLMVVAGAGCSRRYHDMPAYLPFTVKDYDNHSVGRFKTSFLADQIETYYRGSNPGPIGITTFVNVDELHSTSTFGRMYAEQLMSELAIKGFDVVELRHADALQFLSDSGEFALTRDPGSLRRYRELGGVIVGTYVVSPVRVYVNARLVDPSTSLVLSAGSAEMTKTSELARLLRGGSLPSTLERIPVRHLGQSAWPMMAWPTSYSVRHDVEDSVPPQFYSPPPAPVKHKKAAVAEKKHEESVSHASSDDGAAGDGESSE